MKQIKPLLTSTIKLVVGVCIIIPTPLFIVNSCAVTDFFKFNMAIMNSRMWPTLNGDFNPGRPNSPFTYIEGSSTVMGWPYGTIRYEHPTWWELYDLLLFVNYVDVRVELRNYKDFISDSTLWYKDTTNKEMYTVNTLDALLGFGYVYSVNVNFGAVAESHGADWDDDYKGGTYTPGSGWYMRSVGVSTWPNATNWKAYPFWPGSNSHTYYNGDFDNVIKTHKMGSHEFGVAGFLSGMRLYYDSGHKVNSLTVRPDANYTRPIALNAYYSVDGHSGLTGWEEVKQHYFPWYSTNLTYLDKGSARPFRKWVITDDTRFA